MIPLNSWQRLPPQAMWFGFLSSLVMGAVLVAAGTLMLISGHAGTLKCTGSACGTGAGGLAAGFIYLYAIFLVGRSVLHYKTFAFLLTDKTLSTYTGYFFRKSSTFRFDKIQDIDTFRGPLHAFLGVTTVAIWTASIDQLARNKRRPDGRIVLDDSRADWLGDYLSNPATVGDGGGAAGPAHAALPIDAPRANGALIVAVCVAAALAVPVLLLWNGASITHPGTATSAVTRPSAAIEPSPSQPPAVRVHPTRVISPVSAAEPSPRQQAGPAAAASPAVPADYSIACAIHGSGNTDGVIPCAKFDVAQRCAHEADFASKPTPAPAVLTVVNQSAEPLRFYWLNPSGTRALYASLPPGGHVTQPSHVGAHWLVSGGDDRCIAIFSAATTTIGIY